jgi:hypothetical protein
MTQQPDDPAYFKYDGLLTEAEAFVALFNASKPQGMGFLQPWQRELTLDEAESVLEDYDYIDYYRGRVIKCAFDKLGVHLRLYDRDNGHNAGRNALLHAIEQKKGAK